MEAKDAQTDYAPLRTLRDVEELERVPLDQRVFSWNLNDWLAQGCARDPAKVAIRYIADGNPDGTPTTLTYGELAKRGRQAANLFHKLGVGPQDAVLFMLPTTPELYVVMLGAVAAGVACSINWMLKGEQLTELIRSTQAKVIVALGPTPGYEIWENLQAVRGEIQASTHILTVSGPGGETLADSDLMTRAAREPGDLTFTRNVAPDDLAAYIHSGGTTGSPKLVKLTHRGFAYKCWANAVIMAHTPDDVIFSDYPMFHIAGAFGRGYFAVAHGMSIVIPTPMGARDKRFIENYWKFVDKFKITVFSGVPTTLAQLAKSKPKGENLATLRRYMPTGSTAFPSEVGRQIEAAIGVRVLLTYGATEYTQNVTQAPRDGDPKYGSPGLRIPYTDVRVVELDDNGHIKRDCHTDEIGVVVVKGPSVTPGYLDPKYNAGIFTADGYFNSGDLGRFDRDGYLWLTGRVKDVIIRGGHNIDPTVIEEALLKHDEVLLAAAVSKPDAYAGELPIAYVQLVPNARVSADELRAFALERIPERAAAPKDVIVLDRIPLTDVGKPVKNWLRTDAARRAFSEVLAEIAGPDKLVVDVIADPVKGQIAVITIADAGARTTIEPKVHERMKAFTVAYRIEGGVPAVPPA
jgi:fatty-acyl-CoA synthase